MLGEEVKDSNIQFVFVTYYLTCRYSFGWTNYDELGESFLDEVVGDINVSFVII